MKLHLMNPHFRHGSTFLYDQEGAFVGCPDNHLQYIHSGTASFTVMGETHMLYPDTLLYCPKGFIYRLDPMSELKISSVNFDLGQSECTDVTVRNPRKHPPEVPIPSDALLPLVAEEDSILLRPAFFYHAAEFLPMFRHMLEVYQRDMPYSRAICSCLLKEILIKLHYTPQNPSSDSQQVIRTILAYIEEHYTQPITNEKLAEQFGYHPNYLCRLFKNNVQMTLQQYILNLRISQAKSLISETELPLLEVSGLAGFQDYPYFSAYFKKKTGLSPAEYRKQSRRII